MFPRQLGQLFTPADRRADSLVFVGGNRHAIGAAAEQDAECRLAFFNRLCDRMRKISIVHRIPRMRAEIGIHNALAFKEGNRVFFVVKSGMIAADGNRFC